MKRMQLFELEDQPWFPHWLRVRMTRFIHALHGLLGTAEQLESLLLRVLPHTSQKSIVDLCSGSGGPMIDCVNRLRQGEGLHELQLVLTDLYPDREMVRKLRHEDTHISYREKPVNAAEVGDDLEGLRTMICSFHHMPPDVAVGILANAQEAGQPICIYEISDNSFPRWLWWLSIPTTFIFSLLVTLKVRPLDGRQLLFTYLIPLLPLCIAWDGAVSNARTYTLEDLDRLLEQLPHADYHWEKGTLPGKGGKKIYLLGWPETN